MSDDVTFVRDKHTFKTGFFYTHDRWDGYGQHRPNGGFGFSNQATSTWRHFAELRQRVRFVPARLRPAAVSKLPWFRQIWNYMGGYIQDDWRAAESHH